MKGIMKDYVSKLPWESKDFCAGFFGHRALKQPTKGLNLLGQVVLA